MPPTAERNGVLLYICVPGHRTALIGDLGIHAKVEEGFWQDVLDQVIAAFREERYADGIIAGVHRVGERLSAHFPRRSDDRNELSDDISIRRR